MSLALLYYNMNNFATFLLSSLYWVFHLYIINIVIYVFRLWWRHTGQSRPYWYYVLLTPWKQSMCQLVWSLYSVITTRNHLPICKHSHLFHASARCIIRWNITETVGLPITERDAKFVDSITFCMFNSALSFDDIWSYHLQAFVWLVRYLIYWQKMFFPSQYYEVGCPPWCYWDATSEIQTTYTDIYCIHLIWFDLIECFTTSLLHTHCVDEDDDEDEIVLKEKSEDTRYIRKITSK